jgi:hypothetical protein
MAETNEADHGHYRLEPEIFDEWSPVIEQVQRSGVTSLSGVARELELRGVRTRKNGRWSAAQVSSIIRRGEVRS